MSGLKPSWWAVWVSSFFILLILFLFCNTLLFAASARFVITSGGDKIYVDGQTKHKLVLRIIGGEGKLLLRQYLVESLRNERGDIFNGQLRCGVRFVGAGRGYLEWLSGEMITTSAKLVYTGSDSDSNGLSLEFTYWMDNRFNMSAGTYVGRLAIVLSDSKGSYVLTVPVEVVVLPRGKRVKVLDGDEEVLTLHDGQISRIQVFSFSDKANIRLRFISGTSSAGNDDLLEWSAQPYVGRWFPLARSLSVSGYDKGGTIFLRISPKALSGEYAGRIQLYDGARLLGEVRVSAFVPEKTMLDIEDSSVVLRLDKQEKDVLGSVIMTVSGNAPGGYLLFFQPVGSALYGNGSLSIPIDYLEYAVMQEVGNGKWKLISSWRPVVLGRNSLIRLNITGKNDVGKKIRLKVCYRFKKEVMNKVYAGEYEIPVSLSLVRL